MTGAVLLMGAMVGMSEGRAAACGLCAFSEFDRGLPFVWAWSWIGLGWFAASSAIAQYGDLSLRRIPRPLFAVVLCILACLAGMSVMGPFAFAPFGALAAVQWAVALRRGFGRKEAIGEPGAWPVLRVYRWFGGVMVVVLCVFAGLGIWRAAHQTAADYVMRWPGTSGSRSEINRLRRDGDAGAFQLREVMRRSESYEGWNAALVLAKMETLQIDVPLMIDAMARAEAARGRGGDSYLASAYGQPLRDATKLDLPHDARAAQWRDAWAQARETSGPLVSGRDHTEEGTIMKTAATAP